MARQWRIEYEGAYYHVISRGNEGRDIYGEDDDREIFLTVIGEMCDRFDMEVYAWVLMTNHYHLLLKTNRSNLSKGMQWLGATYTRRYNIKYKRRGHLFQGRYKSLLVQDDAYVFRLSCYIHRNPVRAKIVQRLSDYRWSSYTAYAYGTPGHKWLHTDLILSLVSGKDKHCAYREKVQEYSGEENRFLENIKLGIVVGTKEFASSIKKTYLPDNHNEEIPQQKITKEDMDLESIINSAAAMIGCDIDELRNAKRIRPADKKNRDLLVYMAWKTGAFTNKEIGQQLGLTYSAVSYCVKTAEKLIAKDKTLEGDFRRLNSLFKM